jgi:purine-binding chemotaxis protein CheW
MNKSDVDSEQGRSFDWEAIRRRVAEASAALEESIEISPEDLKKAWAQRAADLARVPVEEDTGKQVRLVLIRLGREIYGIDAQFVSYVRPTDQITYVPRVPEWVAGVVNLRGRILSVVELRRFFGLPSAEIEEADSTGEEMSYMVVVETPGMEIALLVDDVLTVESVPAGRIRDATGVVRGLRPEYVQGVVTHKVSDADVGERDSMWVVLDLVALLADERLIVHEEIV